MRLLPAVLLVLITSRSVLGQTYTISTVAGGGLPFGIPGTSANLLAGPVTLSVDPAGNAFFRYQNSILRLDAITGLLTAAAGNGSYGFSGDNGPASSAQLNFPEGS